MHTHRHRSRTTFYFLISRWQDNETESSLDFNGNAVYHHVSDQGGKAVLFHGTDKPQRAMTPAALVLGLQTKVLKISWVLIDRMLQNAGQQPACPGDAQGTQKNMQRFPNQLYLLRVKCRSQGDYSRFFHLNKG